MTKFLWRFLHFICLVFSWIGDNRELRDIMNYRESIRSRRDVYNSDGFLGPSIIYGMGYTLRKYARYKHALRLVVEHGAFFSNFNPLSERYQDWGVVLTNSFERVEVLKNHMPNCVIPIGPYIHYANCIVDEFRFKSLKRNLGKTLLVFPMHSLEDCDYSTDKEGFVEFVNKIKDKGNYNTVLACLYFVDVENAGDLFYRKQGWDIVCAGRRENYDYMNILKTIIMLSDYVINQSFSTNVGWSIYLGKPVTIFNVKSYSVRTADGNETKVANSYENAYDEKLKDLLTTYSEKIDKDVWDYFSYHYGFEFVRTHEEMKLICEFSRKVGKKKNKWRIIAKKNKYSSIFDAEIAYTRRGGEQR